MNICWNEGMEGGEVELCCRPNDSVGALELEWLFPVLGLYSLDLIRYRIWTVPEKGKTLGKVDLCNGGNS